MKFQERLTFANVVSVLALILALAGTGGVAYAHGKIGSGDLKTNAVKSRHIANGHVRTPDLKNNSVQGNKVKNGSLRGVDIRNGTLTSRDFSTGADGVALAGASVVGTAVPSSFNRLGGQITVTNPSPGNYDVTIPGAHFSSWQTALVSVSGVVNGNCYVNFVDGASPSTLEVACRDLAGAPANKYFKLVVFEEDVDGPPSRIAPRKADGN